MYDPFSSFSDKHLPEPKHDREAAEFAGRARRFAQRVVAAIRRVEKYQEKYMGTKRRKFAEADGEDLRERLLDYIRECSDDELEALAKTITSDMDDDPDSGSRASVPDEMAEKFSDSLVARVPDPNARRAGHHQWPSREDLAKYGNRTRA